MVRSQLGLRPAQLPESKLRSLWRALDDDGSGFITAKEFGSFMRVGTAASGPGGWRERLTAHNRSEAEELTRKLNEERNAMARVQPASKDEVGELSCKMHSCMLEKKQKNWFHLFKLMDQDGSGRVTYLEFLEMVRSDVAGLALRPAQLPDSQLQSLWRALDDDGSGFITAKEFGTFMRRGEAAAGGKGATWLELRTAKHRAGAEAMLAERNKQRDAMADVPAASDTEMRALAEQLHASMVDRNHNHWFRLFKLMDVDNSGIVMFVELQDIVRGELEMSTKQLSEASLKSLWVSLDSDRSGHITAKEFGQFMKRGVPEAVKTSRGAVLEKKRLIAVRNRVGLEQEKVERMESELRAAARKVKAHEAEKALLQAELQKLTGKASSASLLASLEQSHGRQTLLPHSELQQLRAELGEALDGR